MASPAEIGPRYWARLHAWAEEFRQEIAGECGCGEFAVKAVTALHDLVNAKLGKPLHDPENFQAFQSAVDAVELFELSASGHARQHQNGQDGTENGLRIDLGQGRELLLTMERAIASPPKEQLGLDLFPVTPSVAPTPATTSPGLPGLPGPGDVEEQIRALEAELQRLRGLLPRAAPTGGLAPAPVGPAPGEKYQPYPFQVEGIAWLKDKSAALLADDMGLGKTVQAIYWAADGRLPALVVVPAAVAYNWQNELKDKWRPGDSVTLLFTGEAETLPRKLSDWTITTYSQVQKFLPMLKRAPFKAIIIDEAQYIKTPDAKRTKAVLDLVAPEKATPNQTPIPNRLAVTGTPIMNRPPELFPILVFLGKAPREGYRRFVDQYAERREAAGREYFVGYRDLEGLHQRIQPFTLRRLKKDVLTQLPPKIQRPMWVGLTNASEYREAERNFLEWYRRNVGDEAADKIAYSVQMQILVQLGQLRQVAARGKIGPVLDFLRPCQESGHKVLVFSNFVDVVEEMQEAKGGLLYTGATPKDERDEMVQRFQTDPATCFFFGTIGAAGVGITLTAADRAVFVDLPWTPAAKAQAEDRAHRIGQTKQVEVIAFLAKGTVDERVMELLAEKEKIIAQAVDGLSADQALQSSITAGLIKSYREVAYGRQASLSVPGYLGDEDVETVEGWRQEFTYPESKPTSFVIEEPGVITGPDLDGIVPSQFGALEVQTQLRRSRRRPEELVRISNPEETQPFFEKLRGADREYVMVLYMDWRNAVIGVQQLNIGERAQSLVATDAIIRAALLLGASQMIVAHNHPSGDPTPSDADRSFWAILQNFHLEGAKSTAGKVTQLKFLDMMVVGASADYSLAAGRLFPVSGIPSLTPDFKEKVERLLPQQPAGQPVLFQGRDPWGSRCRDPKTGEWVDAGLCGPVPQDGRPALPSAPAKTMALSADGLRRYEFEHRVVEASTVIPSHDPFTFQVNPAFAQKFQPRMRDRAAAELQVMRIAAQLSPDALLTDFHTLDRGAPIVGPDMLVESGNGRVMGLLRSIQDFPENYALYKAELVKRAESVGLRPSAVLALKAPVLVRVRKTELEDKDRTAFVQEANVPSGISRSAIEQARTDSEKITLAMLESLQVGENEGIIDALRTSGNAGFVRAFLGSLPQNEQAQLLDSQGRVNQDGLRRTSQAIFVSAFGGGEPGLRLGEMAFESADQDVRAVFNGISRALGPLAKAESLVRNKARPVGLSIGDDLAQTVRIYAKIKNDPSLTVAKYLGQSQMFERELTPFQEVMLRSLDEHRRSAKRLGAIFSAYAGLVNELPPPEQGGLFGPAEPPAKEIVWDQALRRAERPEQPKEREAVLVQEGTPWPTEAKGQYAQRIRWCNTPVAARERILTWRPLRNLLYQGIAYQVAVEVCEAGFGGDQYQVSIGYTAEGAWRKGYLTGGQVKALRKTAEPMGDALFKEVLTRDPGVLIFQVTLPGQEAEDLVLKPQLPARERDEKLRTPAAERDLQSSLFQKAAMAEERGLFPLDVEEYSEGKEEDDDDEVGGGNGGNSGGNGGSGGDDTRPGRPTIRHRKGKQGVKARKDAKMNRQDKAAMSNAFLSMVLGGAANAVGAAVGFGLSEVLSKVWKSGKEKHEEPTFQVVRCHDDETWDESAKLCKPTAPVKRAAAPVPSVVNPGYVEGDQAQVDIGNLLEELDAILKKPETMGEVDANTLRVVRE